MLGGVLSDAQAAGVVQIWPWFGFHVVFLMVFDQPSGHPLRMGAVAFLLVAET